MRFFGRSAVLVFSSIVLTGCSYLAPGINRGPNPGDFGGVKIIPITASNCVDQQNGYLRTMQRIPNTPLKHYHYLIGPNDVLTINVWNHPELNNPSVAMLATTTPPQQSGLPVPQFTQPYTRVDQTTFTVDPNGNIVYPYLGLVKVAGKTLPQVRLLLTQKITKYVRKPVVNVSILSYNSKRVTVTGEVNKANVFGLSDTPTSIIEMIDLAGGPTPEGDLRHVTLNRGGQGYELNLIDSPQSFAASKIALQGNDIIDVPNYNERKVFIFGEVLTQTPIILNIRDMTLTEALAAGGGINQITSNPQLVFVLRREEDQLVAYKLNAMSPAALILGSEFKLQNHDVIYVGTYKLTNWARIISQVLPNGFISSRAVNYPIQQSQVLQ